MIGQIRILAEIFAEVCHYFDRPAQIHVVATVVGIPFPIDPNLIRLLVQVYILHAFLLSERFDRVYPIPVIVGSRRHAVQDDLNPSLVAELFDPVKIETVERRDIDPSFFKIQVQILVFSLIFAHIFIDRVSSVIDHDPFALDRSFPDIVIFKE